MTEAGRSEHLTMYGLSGVALLLVIGVLVIASVSVLPVGWMVVLIGLWLGAAVAGAAWWSKTVWVPMLAALAIFALWMFAVFTNR